jgi:hypothetical protein
MLLLLITLFAAAYPLRTLPGDRDRDRARPVRAARSVVVLVAR